MEAWQKLLAVGAGAAGVGVLLCYLLKEESEAEVEEEIAALKGAAASPGSAVAQGGASVGVSKEDLLQILKEMVESQQGTTAKLRGVAKKMAEADAATLTFDKVYHMVKVAETKDPLEERGLTMNDLEEPLQRDQNDPQVLMAMQMLMSGGQDEMAMAQATPSQDITVAKLVEINTLLLTELDEFINSYLSLPDKKKYDIKTVMIMVQATLDSKVMKKFGFESSDVQAATMQNQQKLSQNKGFIESHMSMQQKMETFVKMIQGSP